jgi:hypothetical protein
LLQFTLALIFASALAMALLALVTWLFIRIWAYNLVPHLAFQIVFLIFSFYGTKLLGTYTHAVDLRIVILVGLWLATPIYYLGIVPLLFREMSRSFHLFRIVFGAFYCLVILGLIAFV